MNRKRLGVYPFNHETIPLARYCKMTDYTVTTVVSPKGWGTCGHDASWVDRGPFLGLTVKDDFDEIINNCDAVFINYDSSLSDEIKTNIDKAYCAGLHIIVPADMGGIDIAYYPKIQRLHKPDIDLRVQQSKVLIPVPIPVVAVMGLGERCQKFDIQLGLRDAFISRGYKVAQLGTKSYSALFGFDPMPDLSSLPLPNKIAVINHYVNKLIQDQCADVLIIGVPGGVMPISRHIHNDFGEAALAIATAVEPDISVLSVHHSHVNEDYIAAMQTYMQYRLGAVTKHIHMSNIKTIISTETPYKVGYLTVDSAGMGEEYASLLEIPSITAFHCGVTSECQQAYDDIINQLESNIEVI